MWSLDIESPDQMVDLGSALGSYLREGDLVALEGELGAGKTTLIRGVLKRLGHEGAVRSPTFNIIQTFDLALPVMHADLYRVSSSTGLGLEDYLDTHLCLIEWPNRLQEHVNENRHWAINMEFSATGRKVFIEAPCGRSSPEF